MPAELMNSMERHKESQRAKPVKALPFREDLIAVLRGIASNQSPKEMAKAVADMLQSASDGKSFTVDARFDTPELIRQIEADWNVRHSAGRKS